MKITYNVAFEFFQFWHFPQIFVQSKVTPLVTLFDRKLQIFKNSPKWPLFGIFNQLLSTQNGNIARFARNVKCDFLGDFQTLCQRANKRKLFLLNVNDRRPWKSHGNFSRKMLPISSLVWKSGKKNYYVEMTRQFFTFTY